MPQSRKSNAGSKRKRPPTTRRVRDRRGRAVRTVTLTDIRRRTGLVLRDATDNGTLAVMKDGKPVAVVLSWGEFLSVVLGLEV